MTFLSRPTFDTDPRLRCDYHNTDPACDKKSCTRKNSTKYFYMTCQYLLEFIPEVMPVSRKHYLEQAGSGTGKQRRAPPASRASPENRQGRSSPLYDTGRESPRELVQGRESPREVVQGRASPRNASPVAVQIPEKENLPRKPNSFVGKAKAGQAGCGRGYPANGKANLITNYQSPNQQQGITNMNMANAVERPINPTSSTAMAPPDISPEEPTLPRKPHSNTSALTYEKEGKKEKAFAPTQPTYGKS